MLSALWSRAKEYYYTLIAREISRFSRYYDDLIHWKPLKHDTGTLFTKIECSTKTVLTSLEPPVASKQLYRRDLFLLNGNLNYDLDIIKSLQELAAQMTRTSRAVVVAYNPYLRWVYEIIALLGLRQAPAPSTFITHADLGNLARLAGFEVIRAREVLLFPFHAFGVGDLINRVLPKLPIFRMLSLVTVVTLRLLPTQKTTPSVCVVVPARNEKGNIRPLLERMPQLGPNPMEVIFVEGHSTDGTWEEIEKVVPDFQNKFNIKCFKQSGRGKNDAVRLGFSHASADLLMILDADISVAPEDLNRFYDAWVSGHADFINGSRLTYPMADQAMRFLNRLGNIFFAKALSAVLECRLCDSLCGTKVVLKSDYDRIRSWRIDFGDFDPFGDFELLFPAAILSLGIINVPIYYHERVYGQTNIQRFRHGLMLLKMTWIGLWRVRFGL